METEYSPEAIIAAMSLQTYTYMYASMATFWTYDYTCSLNEEWTFLLESRWTAAKVVYIITRYIPFLLLIGHLYINFINETPEKCHVLNTICDAISLISIICSECFFILRTHALWNHNRIVLAAMLFSLFAVIISAVSIIFATTVTAPFETSAIPGITGCYQATEIQFCIPYLLLFTLELGLFILTLIPAIQNWRTTNGPLYTVLLKHNVEYYACGVFFSGANIFTSLFLQYAYGALLHNFQFITLAILATRMHLYLWHVDRHLRSSEALMVISMTNITSNLGGGSVAASVME